jgi:hypothetical protein
MNCSPKHTDENKGDGISESKLTRNKEMKVDFSARRSLLKYID